MDSGVGPPGPMRGDRRAFQLFQRAIQNALNRRATHLRLPAEIIRAVVCKCDSIFHITRQMLCLLPLCRQVLFVAKQIHRTYKFYRTYMSYSSWGGEFARFTVADQNRVVDDHAPFAGQKLSIARPCEAKDSVGGEVGQLAGRAAVNGLAPYVRDALLRDDISQRATIRGPAEN